MKLLTILFSIYIITLSCLPCADAEITIGKETASLHIDTKSSTDTHLEDTCSPFCICNCCHSSGFYKSNDYIKRAVTVNIFIETQATEYTSAFFSNFHNSIWQPPQIS